MNHSDKTYYYREERKLWMCLSYYLIHAQHNKNYIIWGKSITLLRCNIYYCIRIFLHWRPYLSSLISLWKINDDVPAYHLGYNTLWRFPQVLCIPKHTWITFRPVSIGRTLYGPKGFKEGYNAFRFFVPYSHLPHLKALGRQGRVASRSTHWRSSCSSGLPHIFAENLF